MTINIAIAVAEGLVMAADSMTQIGVPPMISYDAAEKLTEIADLPMAAMVHGIGALANRSILSLIREFEFDLTQDAKYKKLKVAEVCKQLADFVGERYDKMQWGPAPTVPTPPGQSIAWPPTLGIVVGGYSPRDFFSEVYEILFPGKTVNRRHPVPNTPAGSPSITWWGWGHPLNRLLVGFDANTINAAMAQFSNPSAMAHLTAILAKQGKPAPTPPSHNPNTCLEPLKPVLQMAFQLDGMPLKDAVDFADYLGRVVIGYSRFSVGMPAVGGELDVLAIQPEGLSWFRRKEAAETMARARKKNPQ